VTASTVVAIEEAGDVAAESQAVPAPPRRTPAQDAKRLFVKAVSAGAAIVAVPYLWALWNLWNGSFTPLRAVPYDDFYDLQARAMFHGHLWLPPNKMGIEAFIHAGHRFTYFGVFPSILRMPVLLVTSSLDGKLTAPSILLAWLSTFLFTSLLLWRLRILIRGEVVLGRAEAASYGLFMAAVLGGSVILFLAATPFVYSEDFAWSVPLTVGSLFALLGVVERPSWGRVVASGALILVTSLNRTPTGYACTIAAFLVAGWFAFGRGGPGARRWAVPVAAAGLIPFLANCAVTYAKFGIPVGLPMADQVWASVNAHRRQFLAANGGKAFSFAFLPSTIWAYLQPFGIRFSTIFPFVTTPTAPAAALNGAVLDQTYPTASIPATMPLLFLLSIWGMVTAFRPNGPGLVRLTRIMLIGAAAGAGGVLLWGYISERYMADFMPFLILAAGIGLIDVWRRLSGRSLRARRWALGVLTALCAYCIAANVAIAAFPATQWSGSQASEFVSFAQRASLTSLAATVQTGPALPYWAPAGTLFIVGNCSGMYISSGDNEADVPGQQIQHYTWIPVDRDPNFTHGIGFTFNRSATDLNAPVNLVTVGNSALVMRPDGPGHVRIVLENSGTSIAWPSGTSWSIPINTLHAQYRILVTIDPNLHSLNASWYGIHFLGHYIAGAGPSVVGVTPVNHDGPLPVVSISQYPIAMPPTKLCDSLLNQK
jgi:hypothetical protein